MKLTRDHLMARIEDEVAAAADGTHWKKLCRTSDYWKDGFLFEVQTDELLLYRGYDPDKAIALYEKAEPRSEDE